MKAAKPAISPTREENYAEWYQQVVRAADLAETSAVRGCMVIKPWGYGIWENMQRALDDMFKATGHENAYFPLFIPLSFFEKEAQHVDGFAKECAVVTHHRLEPGENGTLIPAGKLEEPLIVRPTSETIIGDTMSRWIQSYRDLPLLLNQWANVVRWEMRTRLFLRTSEFLWQEGHTAHQTQEEAMAETRQMLDVYAKFAEEWMAMPVWCGTKTEAERFPGADTTMCIEAMMQDRKALQAGTSHFLGQNFAKASNISFLDQNGQLQHAWTTSWGVSTRLVGGLVMTHGDDDGIIVPPRLCPQQIVILPVMHKEETRDSVLEYCDRLKAKLQDQSYNGSPMRVHVDRRDMRGGDKAWQWIKRGAPIRVEVGPRDIENHSVFVGTRTQANKDKQSIDTEKFVREAPRMLQSIQDELFRRAQAFAQQHTREIDNEDEFRAYFTPPDTRENEPTPIHGGFALAHFCGDRQVEEKIKSELSVTVRCIPLANGEPGTCPFTGKPSERRVLWAKSY